MTAVFGGALLMLAAWLVEVLFGYPDWLCRRIRHPVVWLGALIDGLDRAFNRPAFGHTQRYVLGMAATVATVTLAACAGVAISSLAIGGASTNCCRSDSAAWWAVPICFDTWK